MYKAWTLLALSLFLPMQMALASEDQVDPSTICIAALHSKPELKALLGKVELTGNVKSQSLEMLASNKKPTKAERIALPIWVASMEQCIQLGKDWRQQRLPVQVNSLVEQYYSDTKLLSADLYGGKTSYGEFAKARASIYTKAAGEIANEAQKEAERKSQQDRQDQQAKADEQRRLDQANQELERRKQEADRENQQALARAKAQEAETRRNAALQALEAVRVGMQRAPMEVPKTTTTNCIRNGDGSINCRSTGY